MFIRDCSKEVNKKGILNCKKLYVDIAFQKNGLGSLLMKVILEIITSKCKEEYRLMGCDDNKFIEPKIFISVYFEIIDAEKFYIKQNFKFVKMIEIPNAESVDYNNIYVNDFSLNFKI